MGYGEPLVVSVKALSYIQWQNATIGITPPVAEKKRMVVTKSEPPVEAIDYNDLEYIRKKMAYENELRLRRVAMALTGANAEVERTDGSTLCFNDLSFEEQVEEVRQMDAGVLNAIYATLEGMATRRVGAYFRPNAEGGTAASGNGAADLQTDALVTGRVEPTSGS